MKSTFWLEQEEGWEGGDTHWGREPQRKWAWKRSNEVRLDKQRLTCLRDFPVGTLATPVDFYYSTSGNPESLPLPYKASPRETQPSRLSPSTSNHFSFLAGSHLPPVAKFTVRVPLLQCLFHMSHSQDPGQNS